MDKLRKLLALVLIGAVISLGGVGCKKKPAPAETPAKETKAGEDAEKEHPAGEKEHPAGEHPK